MSKDYVYNIESNYISIFELTPPCKIYGSYIKSNGDIIMFDVDLKRFADVREYYDLEYQYCERNKYDLELDRRCIFLDFSQYVKTFNIFKQSNWNGVLRCPKDASCFETFDFIHLDNNLDIYLFSTEEERLEVTKKKIQDINRTIDEKIQMLNNIREHLNESKKLNNI